MLVILSVLDDAEARAVMAEAARFGMDVLVEVHDAPEMRRAVALGAALIGINNRDLKTFRTDLGVTERLAGMAGDALVISESGIATRADIDRLASHVDGFLIGSTPMRSGDPHGEARALAFGRVKLCGLRTAADLDAAAPAAFAGLVFVPGTPRNLTLDTALEAIDGARNAPPLVAVFRDQVSDIIDKIPLHAIQLHSASYDTHSVTSLETWIAEAPGDPDPPGRPHRLRQRSRRHRPDLRLVAHRGSPRTSPRPARRRDRHRQCHRRAGSRSLCPRRRFSDG